MTYSKSKNEYYLQLELGEDLMGSLIAFAKKENIHTAHLSIIGGALDVELGAYLIDKKEYIWKKFVAPLGAPYELLSAIGNITLLKNEPFPHVHGVFGDDAFQTFGGHIRNMKVGATCEVIITPADTEIHREMNSAIGLNVWNCPNNV